MRNFSIGLLAWAAALAITPAAWADAFTFSYSGPVTSGPAGTVTLDGMFTTSTPYGSDGGLIITGFTGNYSDSGNGVSGAVGLYPGYATYESYLVSSDGSWNFDNLYYPGLNAPNTTGGQFDLQGLLLYVGQPGDPTQWEVNFWANTATTYQLEESLTGSQQDYLSASSGIGITDPSSPYALFGPSDPPGPIIAPAPEPSSLLLLGTGLLGLSVAAFRKAKASRPASRS